ncbi:uncharacterized protein ARMOST_15805 [Armillaria ostoyae]|uniref:Uncharacterized protein n=1 Tax=Armillaria ostoyae TaxID=47428 RepID=A0A284RUC8_ARMOS|nr:uncharacterized protein ARMOST_15805 [Armillaria ostoyae]
MAPDSNHDVRKGPEPEHFNLRRIGPYSCATTTTTCVFSHGGHPDLPQASTNIPAWPLKLYAIQVALSLQAHSPSALPASLSKLYNDILPSLDAEVPDPNKLPRSAWPGLLQLAVAKANSSFHFQLECEDHIVQLVKGDRAPAPPPPSERSEEISPEWYDIVYSTLLRGDVELRDESRDTELELYVWAYMFHVADDRGTIWRSFRQEMYQLTKFFFAASLPSSYAESPGWFSRGALTAASLASTFTAATSVEENEPPLLSSSSSNEPTSSHAADFDDEAALNRPFRRRNVATRDSIDV